MNQLTKFLLFFCAIALAANLEVQGQSKKTISGVVSSEMEHFTLPGVIVSSQKSKNNTTTDAKGKYKIIVTAGDSLSFHLVGYTPIKIGVGNQSVIDVKLKDNVNQLDNVVVIGYGTTTRQDLTGSVGVVNMADINKAPVASLTEGLAGRIAGVSVSAIGGQPGDQPDIVIRGGNSISQDNSPLYVIDGFPQENAFLDAINPSDIESVTILKDASATAIYGSRGANGVIIIETKKGKLGAPRINYDGSYGIQKVTKFMEMMSVQDFVAYQLELRPTDMTALYLTNPGKTLEDYRNIKGIDWQRMLIQDANWNRHNISLTGGTQGTKYALSASILNRDGVIINSGYERKQGRLSLVQDISKKLKASVNINYSNIKDFGERTASEDLNTNNLSTFLMYRTWGYRPVSSAMISGLDLDGNDFVEDFFDSEITDSRVNPIVSTRNVVRQRERNNLRFDGSLDYKISKNLVLKVAGGYTINTTESEAFNNSRTYRGYPSANNINGINGSYGQTVTGEFLTANTLTYSKKINKLHNINLMAGYTYQGRDLKGNGYSVINVPFEDMGLAGMDLGEPNDVNTSRSKNRLESYLARANYGFADRYLFTATFRADGSSKFVPEKRWGYFPSLAFAWRLKNESFLKDRLKFINDAKLRISHGATGNNRIDDYATFTVISQPYSAYYSINNDKPGIGVNISDYGNRNLKWETTVQTDLGLELSIFKSRINLEVDYYRKETRDMLLNANVPTSSGFSKIYKNVGRMLNQGLEFSLNTTNVDIPSFKWSSNFNISFNKNRVLQLAEDEGTLLSAVKWNSGWNNTFLYNAKVNEPLAMYYGFVWQGNYQYEDFDTNLAGNYELKKDIATNGIDRENIKPGDIKYMDMNGDGLLNDDDLTVIGNAVPTHMGGFNNNFKYKNFSLNVFFQWSYGNQIYNANRMVFEGNLQNVVNLNQYASYVDRWSPANTYSQNFRVGGQGPVGVYSSKYIEDGSYLRLKTISLEYDFPSTLLKRLKVATLSAYVSAQNLYTWTNYSGMDPEASTRHSALTPGFDFSAYPISKNITFGLKIGL